MRFFAFISPYLGMKEAGESLKGVSKGLENIFNDPIKGFGILSEYATKRFTHLTSFGKDRIDKLHPALSEAARVYEDGTLELSRASDVLLRRHRKNVIQKQFAMKRVANVVIDLYVGLAVASRVSAIIEEKGEDNSLEEKEIALTFAKQAGRRIRENFDRIDHNEDEEIKRLSEFAVDNEGYPWDIFE